MNLKTISLILILSSAVYSQNNEWMHFYGPVSSNAAAFEKNLIWIGTDYGLFKYDITTAQKELYQEFNSGLPQNKIISIAIDSKGNKWIGTEFGGVVKFDGHDWTVFSKMSRTKYSITTEYPFNYLKSVTIDKDDNVWVATSNQGAAKYNGKDWTFYSNYNSKVPDTHINCITVDSRNNKWIGTPSGLAKFSDTSCTVYKLSSYGSYSKAASSVCIENDTIIWVANPAGLLKFDGSQWTFYSNATFGLSDYNIYSVFVDNENIKWMSTSKGLIKFNGSVWESYTTSNSGLPGNLINSFLNDAQGNYWIATNRGFVIYDKKSWTQLKLFNQTLPSPGVYCITIDKRGTKWIGTYDGGMVRFDGRDWTVFNKSNTPLRSNTVFNIAIDQQGTKWLACFTGLARFDDTSWTVYTTNNAYFSSDRIQCVAIDSKGNKWLGSDYGLIKFNNGKILDFYYDGNSKIPGNNITAIAIDSHDNVYIAGSGFAKFDGTNWTIYNTYNSGLPNNLVSSIYIDKQNVFWLGTGNGLARFDGINWQVFKKPNTIYNNTNNVSSIAIDQEGNTWFGNFAGQYIVGDGEVQTYGDLVKYNNSGMTIFDNHNSELADRYIYSIAVDADDNKWIGTMFTGIHVYKEGGVKLTNIDTDEQISNLPEAYTLMQNYPNPFNPITTISYSIPKQSQVTLKIYDLLGREAATLVSKEQSPGKYTVRFDGSSLPSGIYIYSLQAGNYRASRKLTVLK